MVINKNSHIYIIKNIIFLLFLSSNLYGQISFEEGYYIKTDGQKVFCQIKNYDWKNNPTEFEYRLSENSETNLAGIDSVKEFGILGISKYLRASVDIDRSTENFSRMSEERNPINIQETLFLKVLIEGEARLFEYVDRDIYRYFYQIDDTIEQLVYKPYKINNRIVKYNNSFRNQIWNELKCGELDMSDVERLKYNKKSLHKYFIKYNKCVGDGYVSYHDINKGKNYFVNLKPGLNYTSFTMFNNSSSLRNSKFPTELNFRFGVEAEFILPFNNNKWSVVIEPTYQYFKSEIELPIQSGVPPEIARVDYRSIEVPIGIRYYAYINEQSKLFANVLIITDFDFNSTLIFDRIEQDFQTENEISSSNNFALGVGYNYNDKYAIEIRYNTPRDILSGYPNWNASYQIVSLIMSYNLF